MEHDTTVYWNVTICYVGTGTWYHVMLELVITVYCNVTTYYTGTYSIEYISKNDDELMEIYEICTYCHSDNYSMIKKGLSVFINILLNNYRKLKSDVNKKNIYKLAKF